MTQLATALSSWPPIIGIISVFFLFLFRKQIADLIDRIVKVGRHGIETASSGQQDNSTLTETDESPADEILRELDSQLLIEREDLIDQELESRGIDDPQERERVLKRYFAAMLTGFEFEHVYRLIWGSQLTALQALNTQGGDGMQLDKLSGIFERAKDAWGGPLEDDTFERWLSFLSNRELVEVDNQRAVLTVKGREFLRYLVGSGYSTEKIF